MKTTVMTFWKLSHFLLFMKKILAKLSSSHFKTAAHSL
ncbi:hypothetical protein BPJM79_10086 [Bacillus pumilus]|uniref:Uncharacterized protein n=1 Tax=Bacillus pumilus TaxID=1408 RepID=A0AB34QSC6_BACPU|nr:hypothetical protein B4127_2519 [Bacillus pumilus]RAP14010.1 hypothetical protein C2W58_02932 [Bacillus pumilus]